MLYSLLHRPVVQSTNTCQVFHFFTVLHSISISLVLTPFPPPSIPPSNELPVLTWGFVRTGWIPDLRPMLLLLCLQFYSSQDCITSLKKRHIHMKWWRGCIWSICSYVQIHIEYRRSQTHTNNYIYSYFSVCNFWLIVRASPRATPPSTIISLQWRL